MVRTVSSRCRSENSSSSKASGLRPGSFITRISSADTSIASSDTSASWRVAAADLPPDHFRRYCRVGGTMHGHQVPRADELVELEKVDLSGLTALRGVQDQEGVVGIHPGLGDLVALAAVTHGHRVEPEDLLQYLGRWVVALRDIEPDEAVFAFQQRRQVVDLAPLGQPRGHQPE